MAPFAVRADIAQLESELAIWRQTKDLEEERDLGAIYNKIMHWPADFLKAKISEIRKELRYGAALEDVWNIGKIFYRNDNAILMLGLLVAENAGIKREGVTVMELTRAIDTAAKAKTASQQAER